MRFVAQIDAEPDGPLPADPSLWPNVKLSTLATRVLVTCLSAPMIARLRGLFFGNVAKECVTIVCDISVQCRYKMTKGAIEAQFMEGIR